MQLTFIGSGDAFGTGGRFNTCFLARHAAGAFLIDCGVTSLVALRKAGVEPEEIDTIFISHLHGDHFGGLPFILLDGQYGAPRSRPLTLVGPPGLEERLDLLMAAIYPGAAPSTWRFPLELIEIAPGERRDVGAVTVEAFPVRHPCGAPPLGLRITADHRILAFSGDTGWTDVLMDLGRNADLLILECSDFVPTTSLHLDYQTISANASRIEARRIMLSHFGPEAYARRSEIKFDQAADGLVVSV